MRSRLLPNDYSNSLTVLLLWAVWFIWNGKKIDLCKWVGNEVISYYYIGLALYVAYTFINGFSGNIVDLIWNINTNQIIGILYLGFVLYWLFGKKQDNCNNLYLGTGCDDIYSDECSSITSCSSTSFLSDCSELTSISSCGSSIGCLFQDGEKLLYCVLIFFIVYNMLYNDGLFAICYDYLYKCIVSLDPKVFMLAIFGCAYMWKGDGEGGGKKKKKKSKSCKRKK